MKKYILVILFAVALSLLACNSAENIDKTDICGKEFSLTTQDPMYADVSKTATTIFNCDGTFTSEETTSMSDPSPEHPLNNDKSPHFTGKWDVVKEIPDNVKQAVLEYGLDKDDHNYSIIEYSSSNGVKGYCIYHLIESRGAIGALYTGQVSHYAWGNIPGAAGIFDGFLKN